MTTEELQKHQNEMAVQRERFHRFWEQIIEPQIRHWHENDKCRHMQKAWALWREETTQPAHEQNRRMGKDE